METDNKESSMEQERIAKLETKVEAIEPKVQMQLVEHSANVSAQSIDSPVTKQEMIDTIVSAVRAMRETEKSVTPSSYDSSKTFTNKLQTLGLADEISQRVEECGLSTVDKSLLVLIGLMVCGLGYMVYFM